MSWAVGQVMDVIRELHIEQNTLALFFSDHGPHMEICEEGGSAGPFRGLRKRLLIKVDQYTHTFLVNTLTLLLGRQEGHLACKKLDVGLLMLMI